MKNNKRSGVPTSEEGKAARRTPKKLEEGRAKARLYNGLSAIRKNKKRIRESGVELPFEGQGKAHSEDPPLQEVRRDHVHSRQGSRLIKENKANGVPVSEPFEAHTLGQRDAGATKCNTKSKELDAGSLWKQVEDVVVPRLGLSVIDHVVYFHLLRHSRLEGKRKLRFSIPWLARNIHLSTCPTREAVRRLAEQGALRLVERSKAGHVAEVRLPDEIRGVRGSGNRAREAERRAGAGDIEDVNFLKNLELRRAIHARERGKCFYCLRRITPRLECLDHVVPRARKGCNSYRNLVSACMECNAQKGEQPAEEFLRWLFREHRLGAAELRGRFEALEQLACGKLRPEVLSQEGQGSHSASANPEQ